jgi:cytosine/adenosine deaminase-related metal-dependent hydrolase
LIVHRAAWVLPIAAPPIRGGWVAVDGDRIVSYGDGDVPRSAAVAAPPLGGDTVAILPALVNAHTHLELSYLQGRVPPSPSFGAWVQQLVEVRRTSGNPFAVGILERIREAIEDARGFGTGLVGDISNTLATVPALRAAGMPAHVFHEVLGFNLSDPAAHVVAARQRIEAVAETDRSVRVSLAPHAPYSVSPALFASIAKEAAACRSSVHLGESPEEVAFLADGSGPIRGALEAIGAWNPEWRAPRCGPVEYLDRFGLLSDRLLVVHGVQLSDVELARLASVGSTLVACPRSNRWVGVGDPPVARFYASGVRVAIGTDSLASVDDLNVFAEMAAIRRLSRAIPARAILASATTNGAEALGFGNEYGTIETGKRASLLAVRVPASVEDVEEYLVGGVEPADVHWLNP